MMINVHKITISTLQASLLIASLAVAPAAFGTNPCESSSNNNSIYLDASFQGKDMGKSESPYAQFSEALSHLRSNAAITTLCATGPFEGSWEFGPLPMAELTIHAHGNETSMDAQGQPVWRIGKWE